MKTYFSSPWLHYLLIVAPGHLEINHFFADLLAPVQNLVEELRMRGVKAGMMQKEKMLIEKKTSDDPASRFSFFMPPKHKKLICENVIEIFGSLGHFF